jgi:hypothetical protein
MTEKDSVSAGVFLDSPRRSAVKNIFLSPSASHEPRDHSLDIAAVGGLFTLFKPDPAG